MPALSPLANPFDVTAWRFAVVRREIVGGISGDVDRKAAGSRPSGVEGSGGEYGHCCWGSGDWARERLE
jgi:hypothetical protein